MSLNTAVNTAQMSLAANAKQISVSARNVAGADDPNYSRKIAQLVTINGTVRAAGPVRASDPMLYERFLSSTALSARTEALRNGYMRLAMTVGDTAAGTSLVARNGKMIDALREYANAPNDDNLAREAITQAKELTRSLNDAVRTIEDLRIETETNIYGSVSDLNKLLADFEKLNTRIVDGTSTGRDVTDFLDQRDRVLAEISSQIGVSTVSRANNDMVIYTDGGVTLFERTARAVEVVSPAPGSLYVTVDNVRVTGHGAPMPSKSGQLVGLMELHNEVLPEYARQLDEIAFGLINAFQEADPDGMASNLAGLFTNRGSATLPASALPAAGDRPGWLAAVISVNPAVDPSIGGDVQKLRNGINYTYNTENAPSFGTHLFSLLASAEGKQASLGNKTLLEYSASSVSWVEGGRQRADNDNGAATAVLQLITISLSNARGVDINDEAATQLQLERSFSASAQLISIVNSMFKTLLDMVR